MGTEFNKTLNKNNKSNFSITKSLKIKKSFLFVLFLFFTSALYSQGPIDKGQNQINAGFGLSTWGLPVYVGIDHGIEKDITLGGEVSLRSFNSIWKTVNYNHTIFTVSANVNYHFNSLLNLSSEWNVYAGINIGFNAVSSPKTYHGKINSGLGRGIQIGGRYYFNPKTAVNFEFGGGNAFSSGKLGVSVKL